MDGMNYVEQTDGRRMAKYEECYRAGRGETFVRRTRCRGFPSCFAHHSYTHTHASRDTSNIRRRHTLLSLALFASSSSSASSQSSLNSTSIISPSNNTFFPESSFCLLPFCVCVTRFTLRTIWCVCCVTCVWRHTTSCRSDETTGNVRL